jgi:hypothetical protein
VIASRVRRPAPPLHDDPVIASISQVMRQTAEAETLVAFS